MNTGLPVEKTVTVHCLKKRQSNKKSQTPPKVRKPTNEDISNLHTWLTC